MQKLVSKNTALFLCDIQEKFRPLIYQMNDVINTAKKLNEFANITKIPVIVTEQYPKSLGSTCSELDISKAEIVEPKTKFSMVIPKVDQYLKEKQIKNVILCGIEAHVCIYQTAFDLADRNINVHLIADGISTINKGERKVALNRFRDAKLNVISSECLIFQFMQDANHPNFKEISGLVKAYKNETRDNKLFDF
eukprot:NODE_62_length_26495_cov_0.832853.p15 type:complete len:194 gc:universal NODE_62_length_26495_cov_0.832853:10095-9514(-)